MNPLENKNSSPKTRAVRLKKVRNLLGFSAEELSKLMGFTRQTISYWESADKEGGLSTKGAAKLAEVASRNGIFVDVPWLMYGIGENMPIFKNNHDIQINDKKEISTDHWRGAINELLSNLNFFKEIESFLLAHEKNVVATILDDNMEPMYEKGDWVGGQLITPDKNLSGKICIVEINEKPEVRMIKAGKLNKTFHISCLKKTETGLDVELKNVACITRVWKKQGVLAP